MALHLHSDTGNAPPAGEERLEGVSGILGGHSLPCGQIAYAGKVDTVPGDANGRRKVRWAHSEDPQLVEDPLDGLSLKTQRVMGIDQDHEAALDSRPDRVRMLVNVDVHRNPEIHLW